jgi:hypothetical protein
MAGLSISHISSFPLNTDDLPLMYVYIYTYEMIFVLKAMCTDLSYEQQIALALQPMTNRSL